MARTCADAALNTITGRKSLAPRRAPYFRAVRSGLRIGYARKPGQAAGVWIARLALPNNVVVQKSLGGADDYPVSANGLDVLSYAQAVDQAQRWAQDEPARRARAATLGNAAGGPVTVKVALIAYQDVKVTAGQKTRAAEIGILLNRHVPAALAAKPVSGLDAPILNAWVAALRRPDRPLAQGTLDKLRSAMATALRRAGVDNAILAAGLGAASVPDRHEPAANNVVLTRAQISALLTALEAIDPALAVFGRACDRTGARPSQLARATLRDLDVANGVLSIPRSHKGRAGQRKSKAGIPFPIGTDFAKQIATQADKQSGMLFSAPKREQNLEGLTGKPGQMAATWHTVGRTAWTKDLWTRPVRTAVKAAGMSDEITLYALRHSRATAMIRAGLALREVAALLDTSAGMLEATYSKYIAHGSATANKVTALLASEAA